MPEYLCPPMRKLNKFMEHFWLAVAIGTALAAGWVILAEGYDAGKSWLLFPAIALAMYFMRRLGAIIFVRPSFPSLCRFLLPTSSCSS